MQNEKLFIVRSLSRPEMTRKQEDLTIVANEVKIVLPRKAYSALSHLDNIDYCIQQLKKYSKGIQKPVMGYILERGLGNRETYYRILSEDNAEDLRRRESRFDYITLEDLLKEKEQIKQGKYIMNKGLIIDFAEPYSS